MEELHRQFVVQFLAEIIQETDTTDDQEAFQTSLQAYVDSLRPWLDPSDGPPNPRAIFSLLEGCTFDENSEYITVVLSPEAEALFRAWLRRKQIAENAGLHTSHAWDN
jgi:hypothetical protein